jgi:inorganic pyrophosphatase
MIDDGEGDEKLICVPLNDITKDHLHELTDLSDKAETFKKVIEQFYAHYKDWKNNWQGVNVEFKGWGDAEAARKVVTESITRAKSS